MKRKSILLLSVIPVVAFALYLFIPRTEIVAPAPVGKNIIAFGDSLTQGVGATEGNDYVTLLSAKLGEQVINQGRSGETTEDALKRVDQILKEDPRLVIVMLGGNDYLQRIPKEKTFENLTSIVSRIKYKNADVVLVGVQGGILKDEYKADFEKLADKLEVTYVPNILNGLLGHSEYMSDPIHPNDKGYAVMADRLYPVIKKLLK